MEFFNANSDVKISCTGFEKGLGDMAEHKAAWAVVAGALLPTLDEDDCEDDEVNLSGIKPNVSGMVDPESRDGNARQIDAREYLLHLKQEANALKAALKQEKGKPHDGNMMMGTRIMLPSAEDMLI